jgi:hypothetical protein
VTIKGERCCVCSSVHDVKRTALAREMRGADARMETTERCRAWLSSLWRFYASLGQRCMTTLASGNGLAQYLWGLYAYLGIRLILVTLWLLHVLQGPGSIYVWC